MSATLQENLFSEYFNNCPLITVPGRMHPVTVHYINEIVADVSKLIDRGYEEDSILYGDKTEVASTRKGGLPNEKSKMVSRVLDSEFIPPRPNGVEIVVEAVVGIMRKFTTKGNSSATCGECILVFLSGVGKYAILCCAVSFMSYFRRGYRSSYEDAA